MILMLSSPPTPADALAWIEAPVIKDENGEIIKQAKFYRANNAGGSDLLGLNEGHAQDMHDMIMDPPGQEKWPKESDIHTFREGPLVNVFDLGSVKFYQEAGETWPWGDVTVVYWYENEDDEIPMQIDYVVMIHEDLSKIVRTPCVEEEQEIIDAGRPVNQITVVGKNSYAQNLLLTVEIDLQEGDNAYHCEIHQEDADGNPAPIPNGENLIFYMPYPEGTSMENLFQVRHYADDYSGYRNEEVICTPYGVRFEVDHLSPFVVSWGDDAGDEGDILPPPTELPPTGDNTPIMLYALMMAAAMVYLLTLSRKKIRG